MRLPARRLSRPTFAALSVILVGLVVAGYVGDALAPTLVDTHPPLLLLLNPRNRNLVLVTNQLDPVGYYVAGTVRLMASDPLFYLIGFFYGDAAVRWVERKTPTYGQMLRSIEGFFEKASYPLLFIAPMATSACSPGRQACGLRSSSS